MKYSIGISNFLEEISSLSHSIVFLYFFPLIAEEGFLLSPCYSLELCIQMGISFLLCFLLLLFSQLFVRPPQTAILLFAIFFSLGDGLDFCSCTMSQTSVHSSSGILSDLVPYIYFSLPLYSHKGFDLGHTWSGGFPYFLQFKSEFGNKEFMI